MDVTFGVHSKSDIHEQKEAQRAYFLKKKKRDCSF